MQVAHDALGSDPEEPALVRVCGAEVLERLEVVEVADVLAHVGGGARAPA